MAIGQPEAWQVASGRKLDGSETYESEHFFMFKTSIPRLPWSIRQTNDVPLRLSVFFMAITLLEEPRSMEF
jgi:hypothetical protein